MATEVVVDSSVIIALVTPEEHSQWAKEKINEHQYSHILDLSYYEVANGVKYKILDRVVLKDAEKVFAQAVEIMDLFKVHGFSEISVEVISLALKLNIAVYDAAFLALADKLDVRLLTLDVKMAKKLENTEYHGILEFPNKH